MLADPSSKKKNPRVRTMCGTTVFRGLHLRELPILFSFAQVTSTYLTFLSKVCFVRLLEFIFVLITLCLTNIRFKCTITTGGNVHWARLLLVPGGVCSRRVFAETRQVLPTQGVVKRTGLEATQLPRLGEFSFKGCWYPEGNTSSTTIERI